MAYGVATSTVLLPEPLAVRPSAERTSFRWRQLEADERLKVIERALKPATSA